MKSEKVKTKAVALMVCVMLLMAMGGIVSAMSPNDDPVSTKLDEEISVRAVSYDHWSVINVVETITDLGDGTWLYSYEFTNTEDTPIWQFGIWTTFDAGTATQTTFDQTPSWSADGHDINGVATEYDARNLDPDITWVSHTWAPGWPNSPDSIPVGSYVSGFSYIASVYDPSPKYYFYEVYGSYAVSTGYVTAVGLTGEAGPTISISTDKTSYTTGDTMLVSLDITNPGDALPVSVKIGVEKPDGGIVWFINKPSVTLPTGLEYSKDKVITLPSIPAGTYTWHAILDDPATGLIICEDTASWDFVPAAAPTEDITGVLEQATFAIDFGE